MPPRRIFIDIRVDINPAPSRYAARKGIAVPSGRRGQTYTIEVRPYIAVGLDGVVVAGV
jgi:hypothetical protein